MRELAPRHRPGRPAHPPGPLRRGRGAAPRQGPVHGGAPARRPPAPGPGRPRTGPGHRPAGRAGAGRRPAAGRGAADRARRRRAGRRRLEAATGACAELAERTADLDVPSLQARGGRGAGPGARGLAATGRRGRAARRRRRRARRAPAAVAARPPCWLDLARRAGRGGDDTAAAPRRPGGAAILARSTWCTAARGSRRCCGRPAGPIRPTGGAARTRRRCARDGQVVDGVVRRHERPAGRHQGASLPGRADRRPGRRAPRARPRRPGRGRRPPGGVDRRALGDAGELLDARARAAYRRRIEELRGETDDASPPAGSTRPRHRRPSSTRWSPARPGVRARRARAAGGVGGRTGPAERHPGAACRDPQLAEVVPGAGGVLDRRVRTGLYCSTPPTSRWRRRRTIRWTVHAAGSFRRDERNRRS